MRTRAAGFPAGFDALTSAQQQLLFRIQDATDYGFTAELKAEMAKSDAPAEDKTAVATFLGWN